VGLAEAEGGAAVINPGGFTSRGRSASTPAATIIAANDPNDSQWESASREIAEHLGQLPPDEAARWLENLRPIGRRLALSLQEIFARLAQEDSVDSQRTYVMALGLAKFLRQDPAALARLLVDHARHAPEFHCLLAPLLADRATALAEVRKLAAEEQETEQELAARTSKIGSGRGLPPVDRHCNSILVELMLGDPSRLRHYLRGSHSDQTLRSTLIHRLAPLEIPLATVDSLLEAETEPSVRAALLMSFGEYRRYALPEKLVARFARQWPRYRDDPDAEVHGAALWLAMRWELASGSRSGAKPPQGTGHWYTNGQGQAMVAVRGCLAHDFALSATEVTVAQFRRFNLDYRTQFHEGLDQFLDQKQIDDCPAILVSCDDSMRYCNWLSRQEGLDDRQFCYEELGDGRLGPRPGHLGLLGYRLPDLAEWKCGCRAGSTTRFSFGDSARLLPYYAWYFSNSRSDGQHRARAVGTTKPNALGLFDTYGNAWEWVTRDQGPEMTLLCGGCCDNDPIDLQQVDREKPFSAERREIRVGFRLAQTLKNH
jgi:formylglycine-generating enzyme required for sulfatase activity